MGLTVTNTNTTQLLSILNRTQRTQSNVLTQLSTGLRINKGADDPAGLIALKALQGEITATDQALANNQRTDAVLGVADQALGEIGSLLEEVEGLVVASLSDANISASERAANQAQIDLAIESIDRIVRTTNFNGRRLLDGTGSISTSVTSSEAIQDVKVFSRGELSSDLTLTVTLTTAADEAVFQFGVFSTSTTGGSGNGASEIAITGTLGTATLEIASGQNATSVAATINLAKDNTGVSAVVSGSTSNVIYLVSTTTGSDAFVSVDVLNGVSDLVSGNTLQETAGNVTGVDASGNINGQSFTADGSKVSFNLGGVSGELTLGSAFTSGSSSFSVQTTGGFTFQLGTSDSTRSTIGIDALFSHKLGGQDVGGFLNELKSGGDADLSSASNRALALDIVKDAINDVAVTQGRIGGFQKFQVQTSINSLTASKVGLSDAASVIGDTDYAIATAELNKQSVLLNSGISLLGLANQQASQILSLLG